LRRVKVTLGDRSYEVVIGRGLLGRLEELPEFGAILRGRSLFVVSDETVFDLYGQRLETALAKAGGNLLGRAVMAPGEAHKNVGTLERVWDGLVESGLDRSGLVVALGGGVVGDVAGFAAATFLRGVEFIQVPTTLLAMVDSSVGGKTGVDHPRGKNLLGAFHQPRGVLADLEVLATLPRRESLGGLAEVIKAAVLADAELFELLERQGPGIVDEPEALEEAVARAVKVKARVVGQDEREGGARALLNLGHTLGHAVEVAAGYGRYSHGEAVALGLGFSVRLAQAIREIGREEATRILDLLAAWGYPLRAPELSVDQVMQAMGHDKKRASGRVRWVLPRGIGRADWGRDVDTKTVETLLVEVVGR